jgi:hypothetical protein
LLVAVKEKTDRQSSLAGGQLDLNHLPPQGEDAAVRREEYARPEV